MKRDERDERMKSWIEFVGSLLDPEGRQDIWEKFRASPNTRTVVWSTVLGLSALVIGTVILHLLGLLR